MTTEDEEEEALQDLRRGLGERSGSPVTDAEWAQLAPRVNSGTLLSEGLAGLMKLRGASAPNVPTATPSNRPAQEPSDPKDVQAIRRRLRAECGIEIADADWQDVQQVVDPKKPLKEVYDEVMAYAMAYGVTVKHVPITKSTPAPRRRQSTGRPKTQPNTDVQQVALSHALASVARADTKVKQFREQVLGSHLLPPGEYEAWLQAQPEHVRNALSKIAERLAERYGWQREAAHAFLLTGAEPIVETLRVRTTPEGWIVMEVHPSVGAETVRSHFRAQQEALLRKGARSLKDREVQVVAFVAQRGGKPSSLLEEWNETHPNWAYGRQSELSRAYHNGLGRLQQSHRQVSLRSQH